MLPQRLCNNYVLRRTNCSGPLYLKVHPDTTTACTGRRQVLTVPFHSLDGLTLPSNVLLATSSPLLAEAWGAALATDMAGATQTAAMWACHWHWCMAHIAI